MYYIDLAAVIAKENTGAIFVSKNQHTEFRTLCIDILCHFDYDKVEYSHGFLV